MSAAAGPPRLLYIGDVPVEPTVAGAALIYRLLDGYPAERLAICQSDLADPRRRAAGLPGVRYTEFSIGSRALLHSRLAGLYAGQLLVRAPQRVSVVERLNPEVPDAVLTIAHGYTWRTAHAYAQRHGLPLHLVVHDDCAETARVATLFRAYADRQFAAVYRAASSRLCVSPGMEAHYRSTLHAAGSVIYPTRSRDARAASEPAARLREHSGPFTVAFAGSLNSGHLDVAGRLVRWLERNGGRLQIYGAMVSNTERDWLRSPNVTMETFVPSDQLAHVLRQRADCLLVPMPFDERERLHTVLGFPSKIADYTAVGLPLLIAGPPYSSAVGWARANPGVAAIVDQLDGDLLDQTLTRLETDSEWRWQLAATALRVGEQQFSHARGHRQLLEAVGGAAA